MFAFINPYRCIRCSDCKAAKACSLKAIIRIDKSEPNIVDVTYCRGCGDCIEKCSERAITLKNKY